MFPVESFSMGFKDIIFAQPTPVWKMQRQIAHSALRLDLTSIIASLFLKGKI